MTNFALDVDITIEGFADPATGSYRLRSALRYVDSGTAAVILRGIPDFTTAFDPIGGWSTQSSIAICCGDLESTAGSALVSYLFQARTDPIATLDSDYAAGSTSASANLRPGQSWPSTPFLLYIGRECWKVSTVTGSANPYTLTLSAGFGGTDEADHSSAAYADRHLYTTNQIVTGRKVTLSIVRGIPSKNFLYQRWTGQLEPDPTIDARLSTLNLSARGILVRASDRTLGRGRLRAYGRVGYIGAGPGSGALVRARATELDYTPIRAEGTRVPIVSSDGAIIAPWVYSSEAVGYGGTSEWVFGPPGSGSGGFTRGYTPLLGSTIQSPLSEAEPGEIKEVLLADAGENSPSYSLVRDESGVRSDHPFDILLNIWTSTGTATYSTVGDNGSYDWLPAHWGAAIPVADIDVSGIEDLRNSRPFKGLRARSFLVGHGDSLPTLKEITVSLLQPILCAPAQSSEGKLTIKSVAPGAAATHTLTDANLVIPTESQPWGGFERAAKITMNCARIGASSDYARRILDRGFAKVIQNRYPIGVPELEIDAGHYGFGPFGSGDTHRILSEQGALRWSLTVDRLPFYEATVRITYDDFYSVGEIVTVTHRAVIGDAGTRGVSSHTCCVISVHTDIGKMRQSLTLVDLYPLHKSSHKVAPSWRIATVTDDTHFTISPNEFTSDDTATWVDNATVTLWDRTGLRRDTSGSAGVISGSAVTLTTAWTNKTAVTPDPGDLVRIGTYGSSSYWGDYAYVADTAATLGSGDPPHRWNW